MIDFEESFEFYLIDWYKNNQDKYTDIETAEDLAPDVYDEWANTKQKALGNKSPFEYFDSITSASELIKMFKSDSKSTLLLDRIVCVSECYKLLEKIIFDKAESDKIRQSAFELLLETDYKINLDKCVETLINDSNNNLCELAVEVLEPNAKAVYDKLYASIKSVSADKKSMIVQVLIKAPKTDNTFNVLTECFLSNENTPLYASFIAKYSDDRHIDILKKSLDSCGYVDYTEIKNAIEIMGGTVEEYRDFTNDEEYKKTRG